MISVSELMVRAHFPDATEYIRVPYNLSCESVFELDDEEFPTIESGVIETDTVELQPITLAPPHIVAGMSVKFRRVYYCELP